MHTFIPGLKGWGSRADSEFKVGLSHTVRQFQGKTQVKTKKDPQTYRLLEANSSDMALIHLYSEASITRCLPSKEAMKLPHELGATVSEAWDYNIARNFGQAPTGFWRSPETLCMGV